MECDWAAYNTVIASIQAITNRNQQMAAAVALGFPARISLVQNVSTMMYDLMATVRAVMCRPFAFFASPNYHTALYSFAGLDD